MPSFWHELAGGTVSGVVGMSLVYPLDTVKSRLQTSRQAKYSGMTHVLTSMARKEGVMSLYRGLLSPVVGYGVLFAISFSCYGQAGRYFVRRRGAADDAPLTVTETALAGAWAGAMNGPPRQVFERVKGVMQVHEGTKKRPPYTWSGACAVDLVRREGIAMGLFRGMGATMLREPFQFGVYYSSYSIAKEFLMPSDGAELKVPKQFVQLTAGGIAGCVSWLPPLYCLDVLKTRMQTAPPGMYASTWDCAVKTWRADGAQVLVRGLGPSMIRAFPLHAVVFVVYESSTAFLTERSAPSGGAPRQR